MLRFLKAQSWTIFPPPSLLSILGELTRALGFMAVQVQWLPHSPLLLAADPYVQLPPHHCRSEAEAKHALCAPAELTFLMPQIWSPSSGEGHQSSSWASQRPGKSPAMHLPYPLPHS